MIVRWRRAARHAKIAPVGEQRWKRQGKPTPHPHLLVEAAIWATGSGAPAARTEACRLSSRASASRSIDPSSFEFDRILGTRAALPRPGREDPSTSGCASQSFRRCLSIVPGGSLDSVCTRPKVLKKTRMSSVFTPRRSDSRDFPCMSATCVSPGGGREEGGVHLEPINV